MTAGVEPPPPAPPRGQGRRWAALAGIFAALLAAPLAAQTLQQTVARPVVDAAAPSDLSVTIYRDPDRSADAALNPRYPRGLAMISETRRVTLPKGESTIRFEGVAEGMIGVSAIVTGLPGGTIEKNRNAQLLSPAALVDGTLGNRVTVTRTNPATGEASAEEATIRTRADGGLVLETAQGFEAVRCAGLPEKLTFARIPAGLSAQPVFSLDTASPEGGTYEVTLTYLAWGFDWQANYVATLAEKGAGGEAAMRLLSWLTLVNDNGQGFDQAKLQIVAGKLNVESDYRRLADPPRAAPLRLTCYPFGSTAEGSEIPAPWSPPYPMEPMMAPPPPPPAPIMVTGSRVERMAMDSAVAVMTASEENLGDLKLFRVPGRVDVSAKGMKQVAFLDRQAVRGRYLYEAFCDPYRPIDAPGEPGAAALLLVTKNEEAKGLGMALPQGALTLYEPSARGDRLAARTTLRDYAKGQEMELRFGTSRQVFARCNAVGLPAQAGYPRAGWLAMRAELTNANPHPVTLRLVLAGPGVKVRVPGSRVLVKNGNQVVEVTVPANRTRTLDWRLGPVGQ
ncbi:DUF4139 domain-containing protein [Erythrobacter sp. NE805]|uniref:DUF4139 domain-containing protein n=1 Tax=Erythrobacter sp. NE805 TaxID=3389875 RepID=UPI00396B047A